MTDEERQERLATYTQLARESAYEYAEDGLTEVHLEVEHDGQYFQAIAYLPGEDLGDDIVGPVIARRARQLALKMLAHDDAQLSEIRQTDKGE